MLVTTPKIKKKTEDDDEEGAEEGGEDGKQEVELTKKKSKTIVKPAKEDEEKISSWKGWTDAEKKSLKVNTLKEICKELGLKVSGTRAELITRIVEKIPTSTTAPPTTETNSSKQEI